MTKRERILKTYPYKGIDDKRYIKDKKNFFKEGGNGWLYFIGYKDWKGVLEQDAKQKS